MKGAPAIAPPLALNFQTTDFAPSFPALAGLNTAETVMQNGPPPIRVSPVFFGLANFQTPGG